MKSSKRKLFLIVLALIIIGAVFRIGTSLYGSYLSQKQLSEVNKKCEQYLQYPTYSEIDKYNAVSSYNSCYANELNKIYSGDYGHLELLRTLSYLLLAFTGSLMLLGFIIVFISHRKRN